MIEGLFRPDHKGIMRPYIDLDVDFHEPLNVRMKVSFVVDTGADRTLLSSHIAERLRADFNFDLRSLEEGNPIGGIGGQVNTRKAKASLYSAGHG